MATSGKFIELEFHELDLAARETEILVCGTLCVFLHNNLMSSQMILLELCVMIYNNQMIHMVHVFMFHSRRNTSMCQRLDVMTNY